MCTCQCVPCTCAAVAAPLADELAKLKHDARASKAAFDLALISLANLVRYVRRVGGFMFSDDQQTLVDAQAVLKQHGIEVE
jgi:hypothetical protein